MALESRDLEVWLAALQHRHRAALTSAEFLKALRALSVRYVERRSELRSRSPLDSAGKRAAFAAFYAPLHFVTTQEVVRALSAGPKAGGSISRSVRGPREDSESPSAAARASGGGAPRALIIDLGCGTGVASAAWALAVTSARTMDVSARTTTDSSGRRAPLSDDVNLLHPPALLGIDSHPWALAEARWNWGRLGLKGEARRSDLVTEAERLASRRAASVADTGLIAGWSVNELDHGKRRRLLVALVALTKAGAAVLVIEPIARSAVPWWDEWAAAFTLIGGRADEWKFDTGLPPIMAALDDAAGFRRRVLAVRSLSAGL